MIRRPLVVIVHGAALDRPDEEDTRITSAAVSEALGRLGFRTEELVLGLDLSPLAALVESGPYAVFNLVDAIAGECRLAGLAPLALEGLGLPFTGASAQATLAATSKLETKTRLSAAGLPTAEWWIDEPAPAGVRVIVKSVYEHASLGMDERSIVDGARSLGEIAAREARFGGTFFAERFIEGREMHVAFLDGPAGLEALPIQETVFLDTVDRPRIVDYAAKWDVGSEAYTASTRSYGIEAREPALAARIIEIAQGAWGALGLSGYGRIDLRIDAGGTPYVLEANTNPCLAPDAGLAATAAEAGLGYDDLVGRILARAKASPR